MSYRTHVARAVREAREGAGLSRPELSERLGIAVETLRSWERHDGTATVGRGLSPRRAGDIAHALGLPRHWFDQAFALERQSDLTAEHTTKPVIGLLSFAVSMDRDSWLALWDRAKASPEAVRLAALRAQSEGAAE